MPLDEKIKFDMLYGTCYMGDTYIYRLAHIGYGDCPLSS